CIVGVDNVLSLYYKPRSKDTIIVEVSEFNQHRGRILGEHFWKDIFKKIELTPDDKEKSSKLYLCPLGNYLELEKQRWKETKVDVAWFKGWNPNKNATVNMPYPKSKWCDIPDHHGIDEFCGKIPVSLFPEEEAARARAAKAKERVIPDNEASALTTPGAFRWGNAKEQGEKIPTARIRPTLDPASVPQPKQPIVRNYRKVDTVTTEQSMRDVLGPPPAPKHLPMDENGLPSLEWERFDWFDDMEDEDGDEEWRNQEPLNWEIVEEKPSASSVAPSDNGWNVGPSWGDDDDTPAPAPVPAASASKAPEKKPSPGSAPASKPQAWGKKQQPARNAWSTAGAGPKPSTPSSKTSNSDWPSANRGKAKAVSGSGTANRGRGAGRGAKARP
ncbi:hypothetical protein FRB90_007530, partial [Tulasnella sp. 427]